MMRNSLSGLLLVIALTAVLHLTSSLLAKTSAQPKVVAQKWEYCAITEFFGTGKDRAEGYAKITYFETEGHHEHWLKAEGEAIMISNRGNSSVYQRAREKALSDAIAQLGSQGWELVGELRYAKDRHVQLSGEFSTTQDDSALYFKRLKP